MANISFRGRVFATPSAMTLLIEGNEVFSGQVGVGQPLDTEIDLATISTNAGTLAVSLSVTSGVITAGQVLGDFPGGECDIRSSILINGMPPEWPATPIDPMPGGDPQDPVWTGWFFELGAGETITFNITVPA